MGESSKSAPVDFCQTMDDLGKCLGDLGGLIDRLRVIVRDIASRELESCARQDVADARIHKLSVTLEDHILNGEHWPVDS